MRAFTRRSNIRASAWRSAATAGDTSRRRRRRAAGRQDYRGSYFFINGAVYLARTAALLRERRFVVPGVTVLYEMPRERGIDVDSSLDLELAEAVLGMRR